MASTYTTGRAGCDTFWVLTKAGGQHRIHGFDPGEDAIESHPDLGPPTIVYNGGGDRTVITFPSAVSPSCALDHDDGSGSGAPGCLRVVVVGEDLTGVGCLGGHQFGELPITKRG